MFFAVPFPLMRIFVAMGAYELALRLSEDTTLFLLFLSVFSVLFIWVGYVIFYVAINVLRERGLILHDGQERSTSLTDLIKDAHLLVWGEISVYLSEKNDWSITIVYAAIAIVVCVVFTIIFAALYAGVDILVFMK